MVLYWNITREYPKSDLKNSEIYLCKSLPILLTSGMNFWILRLISIYRMLNTNQNTMSIGTVVSDGCGILKLN